MASNVKRMQQLMADLRHDYRTNRPDDTDGYRGTRRILLLWCDYYRAGER